MKFINKYKSFNFNIRKKGSSIKYLILHYTAMHDYISALEHLTNKKSKVSSHFLVNKEGDIFYIVDLKLRAWHAGESFWKGEKDINSHSIGIEIDNSGDILNHENFTKNQISALIKLIHYLKIKYDIDSTNILGHADISPYRKIDPGSKFPWLKFSKLGIGYFPKQISAKNKNKISSYLESKKYIEKRSQVLFMLSYIGYDTTYASYNVSKFSLLIKVYQTHYRKKFITGALDEETENLIMNHFNELLTI